MTIFSDPEILRQLGEAAAKNDAAGDWVTTILPDGTVVDNAKPVDDLLKRIGGDRLPKN